MPVTTKHFNKLIKCNLHKKGWLHWICHIWSLDLVGHYDKQSLEVIFPEAFKHLIRPNEFIPAIFPHCEV